MKFSKKLWIILSFKRINLLLKTEPLNYLSKDMHLFLSKSDYVSTKVISLQPFDKHVDLVFSFWQALEVSTSSFPFYRKKKISIYEFFKKRLHIIFIRHNVRCKSLNFEKHQHFTEVTSTKYHTDLKFQKRAAYPRHTKKLRI